LKKTLSRWKNNKQHFDKFQQVCNYELKAYPKNWVSFFTVGKWKDREELRYYWFRNETLTVWQMLSRDSNVYAWKFYPFPYSLYPSRLSCAWTGTDTAKIYLSYHTEIFLSFFFSKIIIDSTYQIAICLDHNKSIKSEYRKRESNVSS